MLQASGSFIVYHLYSPCLKCSQRPIIKELDMIPMNPIAIQIFKAEFHPPKCSVINPTSSDDREQNKPFAEFNNPVTVDDLP